MFRLAAAEVRYGAGSLLAWLGVMLVMASVPVLETPSVTAVTAVMAFLFLVMPAAAVGFAGVGGATAAQSSQEPTRQDCRTYSSVTDCGQPAELTEKQQACVTAPSRRSEPCTA